MILLSFSLCLSALTLIALTMPKHYEHMLNKKGQLSGKIKGLGFILLIMSIYPCYLLSGVSIGITLWLSVLTLAALLLMWLFTYQSRRVLSINVLLLATSGLWITVF